MSENSSFVSELKIVGVEKIKTKLFNIVIINSCNTFLFYFDEIFLKISVKKSGYDIKAKEKSL